MGWRDLSAWIERVSSRCARTLHFRDRAKKITWQILARLQHPASFPSNFFETLSAPSKCYSYIRSYTFNLVLIKHEAVVFRNISKPHLEGWIASLLSRGFINKNTNGCYVAKSLTAALELSSIFLASFVATILYNHRNSTFAFTFPEKIINNI